MIMLKGILIASVTSLAALPFADIPLIKDAGELSRLGVAGVLGAVALASIYGMCKMYRDGKDDTKEHTTKLYALIESATAQSKETAEVVRTNTGVIVEVKTAMIQCNARGK